MICSVVLGVMSEDRPGIIESLSSLIAAHGGAWTDSKMVTMGGKFAGILLVEIPCSEQQAFSDALQTLEVDGLKVVIEKIQQHAEPGLREFRLEMVGQDRSGIVRDITRLLASYDINLEAWESRVESASMSGEALFIASAVVDVPDTVDLTLLQDDFEELANELMVDIKLSE